MPAPGMAEPWEYRKSSDKPKSRSITRNRATQERNTCQGKPVNNLFSFGRDKKRGCALIITAIVVAVQLRRTAFVNTEKIIPENSPRIDLPAASVRGGMGDGFLTNSFMNETGPASKDTAGKRQTEHEQNEPGKG